jgi:CBS domain-containing protein
MSMNCPACGAKNLEGNDQCSNCGGDLRNTDLPKPASEVEQSVMHLPLTALNMTQVHTVAPGDALDVAVQTLVRQKVDLLHVVENGKLLGVLSVRDILMRAGSDYPSKLKQPIRDFMTTKVETLPPDAPITFALNRMDIGGYRHVPVVTGGGGSRTPAVGNHPGDAGGDIDPAAATGQSAAQGGHILGVVSSRDVLAYIMKHSREQVATEGVTTSHGARP